MIFRRLPGQDFGLYNKQIGAVCKALMLSEIQWLRRPRLALQATVRPSLLVPEASKSVNAEFSRLPEKKSLEEQVRPTGDFLVLITTFCLVEC